ncbi:MAG: glycogen/starch/alpha-glucan phosphorylase, partial [Planctomycetota bacterium]
AIQLNDTHPAVAIPELMRLLVDEEGLRWDAAWDITRRTFAFTNHTLLSEALERWPVSTFGRLLPRHLEIIYEINHHFLGDIHVLFPEDEDRQRRMSVIEEGPEKQIRMAHLAVIGSHSVNGVAELHSRLVRTSLLKDFAEAWPDRFNNKTNGVTQRRWVLLANPRLATAITERIGRGWITDLSQLEQLLPLADDEGFLRELIGIKLKNKRDLARLIAAREHVEVDPDSMFDVHVKRIHEYKRQLMNALHIVTLYRAIRRDPDRPVVPRTFIFGGKAAPGYFMAKLFIRLINDIAGVINRDPIIRGRIRVVFVANYGVSLAERIIPATDLSEQISMAGMEASGTGNMKLSMNGALTLGTLDGANIEIREAVGPDNFFLCGLTAEQAAEMKSNGYDPQRYIAASDRLRDAIELIESGFFNREDRGRYRPVVDYLRHSDPYLVCADFEDYAACQERAAATFAEPMVWARMVLQNIARMGHFSSDRTIRQYAEEIWDVKPVTVEFEDAAISPD